MAITTDYLHNVLDATRLPDTIDKIVQCIKKSKIDFEAIAFRGMSGALIAPSIALALHKGLIMVRKDDNSHSYLKIEGYQSNFPFRYIIIDDLMCSGDTIRSIIKKLGECPSRREGVCQGVFLYWDDAENSILALTDKQKFKSGGLIPVRAVFAK